MKKIISFIARYIRHAPWYVFVYPFFAFSNNAVFPIRWFSQQELVDALKRGKSLIRFGDGEINFFIGLGNPYQRYDTRIEWMLKTIVENYRYTSKYILSVSQPVSIPNWELKQIGRYRVWQPFKIIFTRFFPKDVGYADTHQFYYDNYFESIIAPIFRSKKIIIVTGSKNIALQKDNPKLPWDDIAWIEAPTGDAINTYNDLKKKVLDEISNLQPTNVVLFFAVGPAGKYLMYELTEEGWQCLDIGKRVEIMFTEKSAEYLI